MLAKVSKEKHFWGALFSLCVLALTSPMIARFIVKYNTHRHVKLIENCLENKTIWHFFYPPEFFALC